MKTRRAISIILITFIRFLVVFGKHFTPYDPTEIHISACKQGPSSTYIMGTDQLGRDLFSRIIYASANSTMIAVCVVCICLFVGIILGGTSALVGGKIDNIIMRIADFFQAFPDKVLIIVIAGLLSQSVRGLIVAMTVTSWIPYAKLVRASVFTARNQLYVDATYNMGGSKAYILFKHIIVNVCPPILTYTFQRIGGTILAIVGISYLGLGAQPPTAELGAMLKEANTFLSTHPHMFFFPGLAAAVIVFSFNYVGDYLRDYLDPKNKRGIEL